MRNFRRFCLILVFFAPCALGQQPFLSVPQWRTLRDESSGAAPYENLRYLTGLHRVPATPEFDQAAQFILQRAHEYGLADARSEQYPIDGSKNYGLMRSYLGWTVEEGRLWEVHPQHILLGDWKTDPIRLADYSHSADVETELVDVGDGASEDDYSGKDVRGKIVLADGVLARVQELAIVQRGAAGIVSDMPNQTTAWSGLDTTVVRWGHLEARQSSGFAFMVSRQTAEAMRSRLRSGERIILNAHVKATVGPGHWTVVTATIPGTDPTAGEIVYSCHLDRQRPGANDNGSGCVTILESARVLAHLIESGQLPRPPRTLRFTWGPEVEGTMAFLATHPEIKQRLRADIHMDLVGGDPFKNKSVFHVTATPWSLPSFVTDVGASFLDTIREAASDSAEGEGSADEAIVETRAGASGTRNELFADVTPYSSGSDHDDYDSSTIAVPSLYLRDWPDIYIHTDHDTLLEIAPTKLRRDALLGAASGYSFATADAANAALVLPVLAARAQQRLAQGFNRALLLTQQPELKPEEALFEARNLLTQLLRREQAGLRSFGVYTHSHPQALASSAEALQAQAATLNGWLIQAAGARGAHDANWTPAWRTTAEAARIPRRIGEFGPLTFQNDDVLRDRLGEERLHKILLLSAGSSRFVNVQDKSALYAYEIVNFVDGKRSVADIRDAVSAEFGPIPVNIVSDYLNACEEAKIIAFR